MSKLEKKWYDYLSPLDFEKLCEQILMRFCDQLPDLEIIQNKIEKAYDGRYQVDIKATFSAFNTKINIICECKKYARKIEREKVVVLKGRLDSCKANKGIMMAVNGFQTGAIEYAKEHGIALINIEPISSILPPSGGGSPHINTRKKNGYSSYYSQEEILQISKKMTTHVISALLTQEERVAMKLDTSAGIVKHTSTNQKFVIIEYK